MKTHKKLNIVSLIVYAVCFSWNLLYFWILAGPTGLLSMLVWQYILLFVIVPGAIQLIHIAIKGFNKETLLLPFFFWILNSLNFFLTWNLLWTSTQNDTSYLWSELGACGHLTLPACIVGIAIGAIILVIKNAINKRKN